MLTLKEDFDANDCKIRKRGSSSSSSSSLVRHYRLKRAILVGKRFRTSSPNNLLLQTKLCKEEKFVTVPHKTETKAFDSLSLKSQLKEVRNMLVASKELLKALSHHRIRCQQQQLESSSLNNNNNNKPIVNALRFELDRARVQLDQLIIGEDMRFKHHQFLQKAEKEEEEERISKAMLSMAGEIEVEKKLRRQRERLNKSLGKELDDTKARLAKAMDDLHKEKLAKQEKKEELTRTAACEEEEDEYDDDDDVFV